MAIAPGETNTCRDVLIVGGYDIGAQYSIVIVVAHSAAVPHFMVCDK